MKLHLSNSGSLNSFTGYGDGFVLVNGQRHERAVVVQPERVTDWPVAGFDALAEGDFEALATLAPEIVLLGTGARQRFPHPRLTRALREASIGLEVMDLKAACRTYNILLAEQRRVAAALLFA